MSHVQVNNAVIYSLAHRWLYNMLLSGAGTHETVFLEVPTGGGFYGLQQIGIWASPGKSTVLELSFQKGTPIGTG